MGLLAAHQAAVDHVLRNDDDLPQQRLFFDDADITLNAGDLGQSVIERNQVADAVNRLKLAVPHQLVGKGHAVDDLPRVVQVRHTLEDAPVLLERKVFRRESSCDPYESGLVGEYGAEDKALRIQIHRKRLLNRYFARRHDRGTKATVANYWNWNKEKSF